MMSRRRPGRRGVSRALALAALINVGSMAACGHSSRSTTTSSASSASSSASSGSGGAAMMCGFAPLADSTCEACLDTHCCAERMACAANPTCKSDEACLIQCNFDPDCAGAKCVPLEMPVVPSELDMLKCGLSECPVACKNLAPSCKYLDFIGSNGDVCNACLESKCCAEFTPAAGDFDLGKCIILCSDAACLHDCEQMFPSGIDRDSAQNACGIDNCSPDCGQTCGFFQLSGSDPCNTCLRNTCCDAAAACSRDQRCIDLFSCLQLTSGPNPDPMTCFQMWSSKEIGLAVSMLNCSTTTCKTGCGGPGCGLYASLAPQACQTCITASCCTESSDCGLDPDCAALEICVSLCASDAACVSKCRSSIPLGVSKFDPLAMCESTNCSACP